MDNPLKDTGYLGFTLKDVSYADFYEGRINGIITDNQIQLINKILTDGYAKYYSKYGNYTFNYNDLNR